LNLQSYLAKTYYLYLLFSSRAIVQNDDLRSEAPLSNLLFYNDYWGTPLSHSGSHKSYRPLTSLTFRANYGVSSRSFHLTNVLFHAIATYLFVVYSRHVLPKGKSCVMGGKSASALISGMMFAVHPIHTEAVAGIVGRAEVLSAVFFFSALIAYHRHMRKRNVSGSVGVKVRNNSGKSDANGNVVAFNKGLGKEVSWHENKYLALTALFAACAMFSKEQGITVLGVCFATDLISRGNRGLEAKKRSLMCLVLTAAGLLSLRARAMGFSAPKFAKADNPAASHESAIARALTFLHLPLINARLLLCPDKLSFDWSMDAVPVIDSVADVRNLFTVAFYAVVFLVAKTKVVPLLFRPSSKSERLVAVCSLLMALPFLPASNLLFYVGFVVAERVLYVPSVGLCLLVGHGASRLLKRRRQMAGILLMVALVACAAKTLSRNHDWGDEERLYRSGIAVNPPKGKGEAELTF
jgi:hypothetical protein